MQLVPTAKRYFHTHEILKLSRRVVHFITEAYQLIIWNISRVGSGYTYINVYFIIEALNALISIIEVKMQAFYSLLLKWQSSNCRSVTLNHILTSVSYP